MRVLLTAQLIAVIFILNCNWLGVHAAVQIESGTLNGTQYQSAELYRKGDDFASYFDPISGLLVFEDAPNIAGNIVLVSDLPKRNFWIRMQELKEQGAIAALYMSSNRIPGREFCINNGLDASQIQINVAAVNDREFAPVADLVKNGTEIIVTITSEGNPWSAVIDSLPVQIFSRGVLGGATVGLIVFALYKLIMFVKAQGSHFNVPQICLGLELIANFWRILSTVVDPLGCFQNLPTAFSLYVNAAALPFGTATFVLVTFYWHEIITDSSITIHPFLSRLKIPFFVITLALIAADVIVIVTGYYLDFGATTPITSVYLIISTGFLIFYVITAVQINMRMKAADRVKRVKRLTRVNAKMILNAVSRFCLIITAIAFILSSSTPLGLVVSVFFLAAAMLFDSFARIFLFDVPTKRATSSLTSSDIAPTAAGDTTVNV